MDYTICLFENLIGMSSRPAESDGNPVEGWLLHYRRPDPVIKSTKEKELYGSLGELEITKEDWVIIDPKDNDIRETATSNLIFAKEENCSSRQMGTQWNCPSTAPTLSQGQIYVTSGLPRIRISLHSMRSCFAEQVAGSPHSPPYPNWVGHLKETKFFPLFVLIMRK